VAWLEARAALPSFALLTAFCRSPAFDILCAYFRTPSLITIWHKVNEFYETEPHPSEPPIPYHQDGGLAGETYVRSWTLITPESCGVEAPGIELIPGATDEIAPHGDDPDSDVWGWLKTSKSTIDELLKEQTSWAPVLKRDDMLLFKGTCLHRTYIPEGSRLPRSAQLMTLLPNSAEVRSQIKTDWAILAREYLQFPSTELLRSWHQYPDEPEYWQGGFERVHLPPGPMDFTVRQPPDAAP
jgi:hypothetical protein